MYSQKLFKRQKLEHDKYDIVITKMLQIIAENTSLKRKNQELERELLILKHTATQTKNTDYNNDKAYLYIS